MKLLFRKVINPVLLSGFFIFFSGCLENKETTQKVILRVENIDMSAQDFSRQLARRLRHLDALSAKDPTIVSRTKEEIIKSFITSSLTQLWAAENNISVSDVDVEKEVAAIRKTFQDDLSFRQVLAEENLTFFDWRESIKKRLLEKEIFKFLAKQIQEPTDQEISAYYNANKDQFKRPERIFIRQIVVDDEARLDAIKKILSKEGFAAAAQKYSIGAESKSGGVVGWIEKGSVDFFEPLFKLPIGLYSKTIQSPYGYHLVTIEKKLPAQVLKLDDAKKEIREKLVALREQSLYISWLDAQIKKRKIMKDVEFIRDIEVVTKGPNE